MLQMRTIVQDTSFAVESTDLKELFAASLSMHNLVSARAFALCIVSCMLALLWAAPASAERLYAYRSGRGSITFTSSRPDGKEYWEVAPRAPMYSSFVPGGGGYLWTGFPVMSKYDSLILQSAKLYQLEPAFVKAVVHVESAFNSGARSHKGAMGLMQLMPDTARRFGVGNAYHPVQNMVGGVRYLRWLFERFNGNVKYVLAGYNAGENAVDQYGGIPPYAETQDYVKRVLKMREYYRCDYSRTKEMLI